MRNRSNAAVPILDELQVVQRAIGQAPRHARVERAQDARRAAALAVPVKHGLSGPQPAAGAQHLQPRRRDAEPRGEGGGGGHGGGVVAHGADRASRRLDADAARDPPAWGRHVPGQARAGAQAPAGHRAGWQGCHAPLALGTAAATERRLTGRCQRHHQPGARRVRQLRRRGIVVLRLVAVQPRRRLAHTRCDGSRRRTTKFRANPANPPDWQTSLADAAPGIGACVGRARRRRRGGGYGFTCAPRCHPARRRPRAGGCIGSPRGGTVRCPIARALGADLARGVVGCDGGDGYRRGGPARARA